MLLLKTNAASVASKPHLCAVANDLPTRRFVLFNVSVGALYFFVSKGLEGRCTITGCYSAAVVVGGVGVATRRTLRWTQQSHGVGEFGEDQKVTTKTTVASGAGKITGFEAYYENCITVGFYLGQ
jgi:hypothetical protein